MDDFTKGYLEAALWATSDDGIPLDCDFTVADFAPEALEAVEADCAKFQRENADLLIEFMATATDYYATRASGCGHDFFLTRHRHGAGFWDRGAGAVGEKLTEACAAYSEAEPYPGDDGKLYITI